MPLDDLFSPAGLSALATVLMIDLTLAGDNAVVIALAAAGLPQPIRRRAILAGTAAATGLRILLALVAVRLLAIVGLVLAGGLVLLWVAWKLYREMRQTSATQGLAPGRPSKSFGQALRQIVIADLSMSVDNVLAVAGAARSNVPVLVAGLVISIALTGLASAVLARLLVRHRWIAYLGVAVVAYVAIRMIQDGAVAVIATQRAFPG